MKKIICTVAAAALAATVSVGALAAEDAGPGPLHVEGSRLTDTAGQTVQLRGISTHGLAWYPQYVNADCFRQLHDEWGADVIRLAMYTDEYGGYCNGGDQQALKDLIRSGVEYASQAGMYAIVDWHILSDSDPNIHKDQALAFFEEMSREFAERDNVLYEICNEPNGGTTWQAVKSYALEVIPVIRANDPDAVIIVGTPNWSQFVDQAAADPITGYDNIMYTLHFYADTHRDDLRARMEAAVEAGLPVFITEFGICDASGGGAVNPEQADKWMELADRLQISCVAWNLSNKDETCAILKSGCEKTSGFAAEDLTESGRWVYGMLTGEHLPAPTQPPAANGDESAEKRPALQDGLQLDLELANSWQSEGETFYQYKLTLTNVSGEDRDGWTAEIAFDGDVTLQDGWNGEYTAAGAVLTVRSKDYNAAIPAGGSVTDVGFIVSGGQALSE